MYETDQSVADQENPAPREQGSTGPLASDAGDTVPEMVIRPRKGWIGIDWHELFQSREVLYFFVWRDVKVRYKQTVLGMAWGVLQPLLMMAIFTFIFGRFARIPSDDRPYAIFVFAGLLPWLFFSNGLSQGGLSMVNQQRILSKIYLPRLFIPTAAVGVFLVDMAASFGLYAILMAWYGIAPSWNLVFLPFLIVLLILHTLGWVYVLSAMAVLYRDFRFVIPFLVQVMMYVSPVIYPASMLSKRLQPILSLNPMFGIIEGFRSAILGTPWNVPALVIGTVIAVATFLFGLFYFRRIERHFADVA
jgi:lipopolysaccharide transport system permease protein